MMEGSRYLLSFRTECEMKDVDIADEELFIPFRTFKIGAFQTLLAQGNHYCAKVFPSLVMHIYSCNDEVL